MKTVGLAWVLGLALCAGVLGSEPGIGDSVVVVSDEAEVKSKEGTLGSVSVGTQFSVKQKSGAWLLGLFQIDGQSTWGWMKSSSVRALKRDISRQPFHEFTWHNLLLARAKMDETFNLEDHAGDYMKATRYRVWEEYRNDEFQLERKRIETLAVLRQRLAEFDVERDFLIKANLTFKEYDFASARFPIVEATRHYYWHDEADALTGSLPHRVTVFINDPQLISGIPMELATAERFLARRKGHRGYVDRKVYADIRIRITGVRSEGQLDAEVRWARIYGDKGRTRLLYETPQSPVEIKPDSEDALASTLPTGHAVDRPDAEPPDPIAEHAVPNSSRLAQPATLPALQGKPSDVNQQRFEHGQTCRTQNGSTACRGSCGSCQRSLRTIIGNEAFRQIQRLPF